MKKFGLLGIGQAVIEQEYEDCTMKLYEENPFTLQAMHYTNLMDFIFPFEKNSHRIIKGKEARPTILWAINYEHRAPNGCATLCPEYCEQPSWIAAYAKYLYGTLCKFYRSEAFEHRLWNAQTYIDQRGEQFWKFDSLKSAVDIMFLHLLMSDAPPLSYVSDAKNHLYRKQRSQSIVLHPVAMCTMLKHHV